jgi:ATP-dependent Lon protease
MPEYRLEGNEQRGKSSERIDAQKSEFEELEKKIREAGLPFQVERKALIEKERLRLISPASTEYSLIHDYIDWLLSLPWVQGCVEEIDVEKLEKVLDKEFFGQKKMKERIYEYFSIRQLKKDINGSILCFVGPSGTGKTALAHSIASALDRKFVRLSVAGLSSSQQIKGERFGFTAGSPGMIMKNLKDAGCNNPLFLIEGVDKLGDGIPKGEVISVLLEALDPEHNPSFIDDYLGLTFDLSQVFFIATAQNVDEIPDALMEIFEIIEFTGFIEEEKLQIARGYLVPNQIKRHGLSEGEVKITDEAIKKIVREYTIEEGLRELQKEIEAICRKCARLKASGSGDFWRISAENLTDYLGTPLYIPEIAEKKPEVGVACGLAWTASGGDIMLIEGLRMRGSGQIFSTGQLGGIIRESIQTSHSYVRSKAQLLGINYQDFTNYDIHIHFPSEAIPKDGPSAGITICLVIASVMSEKPIRNDLAMSGEVSLRGNILPVGGIKEKLSAARRVGIRKIVLPTANQRNLPDLPEELISDLEFIWVERMEEVFEKALIGFGEQKKIFEVIKKEVEKAGRKKKTRRKS